MFGWLKKKKRPPPHCIKRSEDPVDVFVSGEKEPLERKRGVAVYAPNALRRVEIPLSASDVRDLAGRSVEIKFTDRTESGRGLETKAAAVLN